MLPDYFEFTLPTKLVYGVGILENIAGSVKQFGPRRAVLVTDEILVKAGPVDKVLRGFASTDIEIVCTFDKIPPNSTVSTVKQCAGLTKKHNCDMIIAIGGGSVIDTAKVANLLAVKGGELDEHMGAYLLDPGEALLPAVFIPTTAGTGSEVTKVAVIADPDNDVKLPFAEEQFLPKMAILDPEVTVSMPPKLTASTGMDALTHAIEAYVDKEWSPASDALCLHAVRLISAYLLRACAHPDDLEARGGMLVGSFLAGVAFSHSMVGMAHGISHALGGVYHIPHGLANALVLPEVMEYNLEAREERFADIATALGITFPQIIEQGRSLLEAGGLGLFKNLTGPAEMVKNWIDTQSFKARGMAKNALGSLLFLDQWVRRQAAAAAVEKVRTLIRQLAHLTGMPLNLRDAGIDDNLAKMDQLIHTALEDGSMLYNPVEPTREAVEKIVEKLYAAKLNPLPVSASDLAPPSQYRGRKGLTNVFTDAEMLYDILGDFYSELADNPDIGPKLLATDLCIRFIYKDPAAIITIDARGKTLKIKRGESEGRPEVTMTMNADFAHLFWHGKANLVTALTRRQVVAKGNVPKTIKLLPILKPAYELYPKFLKARGLERLVL